jgi:hypothetical protein
MAWTYAPTQHMVKSLYYFSSNSNKFFTSALKFFVFNSIHFCFSLNSSKRFHIHCFDVSTDYCSSIYINFIAIVLILCECRCVVLGAYQVRGDLHEHCHADMTLESVLRAVLAIVNILLHFWIHLMKLCHDYFSYLAVYYRPLVFNLFFRVPPDIISLQLCTPKVVGV